MSGVSLTTAVSAGAVVTFLDEQAGGVTYIGKAAPRSSADAPVWQIQRLTSTETTLALEYADGDDRFDNVWADRASLGYS